MKSYINFHTLGGGRGGVGGGGTHFYPLKVLLSGGNMEYFALLLSDC